MFMFGFTDITCDFCCRKCLQFTDDFEIKPGRKVSWLDNTEAFDEEFNFITLSANIGMVISLHNFGGFIYVFVEYEHNGPKRAYIFINDLIKEIDDWWAICSGNWEIDGSTLKSLAAGTMTFLITEPTPYGIFTAEVEFVEGVEYRIYVRRGEDADDECGDDDLTIRFEWDGRDDVKITVGDEDPFFADTEGQSPPLVRIGVCVDEKGVAVIFDNRVFQVCRVPAGYYFAIGASAAGSMWNDVQYSDHYDHNPRCPRCQPSKCFPNFSRTVEGYDITITGIEAGDDCDCPNTIEAYVPFDNTFLGICDETVGGEIELAAYGGAGIQWCSQPVLLSVGMDCSPPGLIILSASLLHAGLIENIWTQQFDADDAPEDINMQNREIDPGGADQGFACAYDNAVITATPRVTAACCGGEPEENPLP